MRAYAAATLAVLCLALAGCASWNPSRDSLGEQANATQRDCLRLFAEFDAKVAQAGVVDGGEARVPGYPYLRATRFLASLQDRVSSREAFAQWIDQLRQTDLHARGLEWRNLTAEESNSATLVRIENCGLQLASAEVDADAARQARLLLAVQVPDDYRTWKRVLGLYALARIPFAAGVRGYQRETEQRFAIPLDQLPVQGRLVRYSLADAPVQSIEDTPQVTSEPLGLPRYSLAVLTDLLRAHAPLFEVDESGPSDCGGALEWDSTARLQVNCQRPTLYHRVSFTRYRNRILLQLQYTLWFGERPKQGVFDLLAGQLDGVVWRVTLDEMGSPLIFDAIHPCGCYHQFFPTPTALGRPKPDSIDEFAFVPQSLPAIKKGQRLMLRLASDTHYIERIVVLRDAPPGEHLYTLQSEDALRSLPAGRGYRSVYAANGLVAGSERAERFLFWPMGIDSPGAMRQSGRHATAFVGRRHFDDANLIERYFDLVQ